MGHIMGLEFQTAAVDATTTDEELEEGSILKLDGVDLRYYTPTEGQIAMAMTYTSKRQQQQDQMAGFIDFFFSVFDLKSQAHLQKRLFDPMDPFDVTTKGGINDIVAALMAEWTGRPIPSASGSTGSRPNTGPSSTPTTSPSISSASPPTDSSTPYTPGS